jgi:hypothetical protein
MNAPTKAQMVKAARDEGLARARAWLQGKIPAVRARTFREWRAICYADAVMAYENEPRFMARLKAWEQGFDGPANGRAASAQPAVAAARDDKQASRATPSDEHQHRAPAGPRDNPKFQDAARAAYELGHLLIALPGDFGSARSVDDEHMQIAAAAQHHAGNAGHTLLGGIEVIGSLIEAVGDAGGTVLEPDVQQRLGTLLRHLAVEAQFMQEIAGNLAHSINEYQQRQAVRVQGGVA